MYGSMGNDFAGRRGPGAGTVRQPDRSSFAADLNTGRSTYELNYVTSEYCKAWKAELEHAGGIIKGRYVFDADKERR